MASSINFRSEVIISFACEFYGSYALNLQFSLMEVCDLNATFDYVINRETHWKKVIRSREFGYNIN